MSKFSNYPSDWTANDLLEKVSFLDGECIRFMGGTDLGGYRRVRWKKSRLFAHRLAWINKHGRIPKGKFVLHRCDVRDCINVDHLWLGTKTDNNKDRDAKGRHACKVTLSERIDIAKSSLRGVDLSRMYGLSPGRISSIRRTYGNTE